MAHIMTTIIYKKNGALSPFPLEKHHLAPIPDIINSSKKGLGGASTLSPFPLSTILNVQLPVNFDKWRKEGFLSPPSDQARCGACYAFAAVGQLADRISIATQKRIRHSLSAQYIVSCLQTEAEYGCGGTFDVPLIYKALMPNGILRGVYRQYVFPFSGQQWDPKINTNSKDPCYYDPSSAECVKTPKPSFCFPPRPSTGMSCTGTIPCDVGYIRRWYPNEIKYSYASVFHLSENTNARTASGKDSIPATMSKQQLNNNIVRIKESIYLYGPVTAVVPIYQDFLTKFSPSSPHWNDKSYIYTVNNDKENHLTGLHHVLIIGWGISSKNIPFWIIKNSWGVWWNYDGYFNTKIGDDLFLVESNCHSGIPLNPETQRPVQPFVHSSRRPNHFNYFNIIYDP